MCPCTRAIIKTYFIHTPYCICKPHHSVMVLSLRLSASWCRLHHQRKVKGVNVVIVEGLTQSHFYKHYLTLRHLRTNYSSVSIWTGCRLYDERRSIHSVGILEFISAFLGPMQRITFTPPSQNVASGIFSNEVPKSDDPSLSKTHMENGQIPKGEKHVKNL